MVSMVDSTHQLWPSLSVLALSSRFDGHSFLASHNSRRTLLSVLALSSRFDGHKIHQSL